MKSIIENFKKLDKITYKIMKYGLEFCFGICILSTIILFTYKTIFSSPTIYYIGLYLLKSSLIFSVEFIACGIVVDSIKKQLI